MPALCGAGARAGSLHGYIGSISLSILQVAFSCTEASCPPEGTVNTGTGNLSWSCCGEAPAAGFAAGTGLVLARAVCQGPEPDRGQGDPRSCLG